MNQIEIGKSTLAGGVGNAKKIIAFDIATLYSLAFSGRGLPFFVNPARTENVGIKRDDSNPLELYGSKDANQVANRNQGLSMENATMHTDNIFLPLYYWTQDNAPDEGTKKLFPICTVESSVNKVIIKTPLVGKEGSVKELIRSEDVAFTIRGLCIGYEGEYPEKSINEMIALYKGNAAIQISHPMVNKFYGGIMRVVVEKLNFPEIKGTSHVVPFEMQMVSDNILKLKIEN